MNSDREFTLKPFELSKSNSKINISGNITRNENKLNITYFLQGDLSKIILSELSNIPTRKNELWRTTCFEFFLGVINSPQYWEFNLSPTGDWNIYRFNDYRQEMVEESAFIALPFNVIKQEHSLNINLEIDLSSIVSLDTNLEIAITSVVKSKKGEISYWALTHPENIADFHNRDSFAIHV